MKIILIAIVFFILYRIIKVYMSPSVRGPGGQGTSAAPANDPPEAPKEQEDTVYDEVCSTYLLES